MTFDGLRESWEERIVARGRAERLARALLWTALGVAAPLLSVAAFAQLPPPEPGTLPGIKLTPGAVYPATEAEVCGKINGLTYEKRSRAALTTRDKRVITRSYGQVPGQDGDHELDHLIPAALAGRSDATNVWWEPGRGHGVEFDYHVKDRLDDYAWRLVCVEHKVSLGVAQGYFTPDWRASYCQLIGGAPCPP